MEVNKTKRTDLFLIDPRNIVVMPGFNVRQDFELDELKEQIKDRGVLNPITVIPFRDSNGEEKYKLVDGERRYRATMLAIQEGADIRFIKALKAPRDSSMESLYLEQMMRNEGKRFTEYECAVMYKRFQDEFGYTQAQIAAVLLWNFAVCKCLGLLELPEYIQRKIATGQMSVSAAREIASSFPDAEQQVEVAKSVIETIRKHGGKTVTCKQINQTLQEAKEARSVAVILRKVCSCLDGDIIVNIDNLASILERTESLNKAISEYKQCCLQVKK